MEGQGRCATQGPRAELRSANWHSCTPTGVPTPHRAARIQGPKLSGAPVPMRSSCLDPAIVEVEYYTAVNTATPAPHSKHGSRPPCIVSTRHTQTGTSHVTPRVRSLNRETLLLRWRLLLGGERASRRGAGGVDAFPLRTSLEEPDSYAFCALLCAGPSPEQGKADQQPKNDSYTRTGETPRNSPLKKEEAHPLETKTAAATNPASCSQTGRLSVT